MSANWEKSRPQRISCLAFDLAGVGDVVGGGVPAVVRKNRAGGADLIEAVHGKSGEATLVVFLAIGAGNPQCQSGLLVEAGRFNVGSEQGPSHVSVDDERRTHRISGGGRDAVGVTVSMAGVAALAGHLGADGRAENRRVFHVVVQKSETHECVEPAAGIPVDFGVQPLAVEDEGSGRVVVRTQEIAGQIGQRRHGRQFRRDRIDAGSRNDLVGKRSAAGSVGVARIGIVDRIRRGLHVAALGVGSGDGGDVEGASRSSSIRSW